jgi:hypothetical protein
VVCCGVLWCVVVCCGVLWCVVVWCGVVWCGVLCCGVLCCVVLCCVGLVILWCGLCGTEHAWFPSLLFQISSLYKKEIINEEQRGILKDLVVAGSIDSLDILWCCCIAFAIFGLQFRLSYKANT